MSHDEPLDPCMQKMKDLLTRDRALTFDSVFLQVVRDHAADDEPPVRDDSQHPLNKLARGESV